MRILKQIIVYIALLIPSVAQAQFYVTGDDPGKLKWNYIDTDNFKVIYPQGADSLARVYAFELEKYKIPVSRGTGYMAGHGDGRLMPVVLHAYNGANGSVKNYSFMNVFRTVFAHNYTIQNTVRLFPSEYI